MDPRLQKICDEVDGAIAAFTCGYDGILLDKHQKATVDVDLVAASLSGAVKNLKGYREDQISDILLTFANTIVAIKVFEEYFAGVIMSKDGNLGRAKLELNKLKVV
jgi:predicted regulator of Ras-like GTPase activity (Roadblock/LC7/MglB family)